MIKALGHICILSSDLNRSLDFYCGALGLKRHFDFFKAGPAAEFRSQRIHHFCFEVDDIDAVREKLIKHGVAVTPKKLGCDQTWQCWCKDPDGVDFEFQQYTDKSSQFTK